MSEDCKNLPSSKSGERGRGREPCKGPAESGTCVKSDTFKIVEEFQALYWDRLRKSENCGANAATLQLKTLKEWVCDLTEQNKVLVATVEELEKEALGRVKTLNEIATCKCTLECRQKQDIAEKNERLCILEDELACLHKTLKQKDTQLSSYTSQIQQLQCQLLQKNVESHTPLAKISGTSERIYEMEREMCKLKEELKKKEVALEQCTMEIDCLKLRLSDKKLRMDQAFECESSRVTELEAQLNCLEQKLKNKEAQLQIRDKQIGDLQRTCLNNSKMASRMMIDTGTMTDEVDGHLEELCEVLREKDEEVDQLREKLRGLEFGGGDSEIQELKTNLLSLQQASLDIQSALTAEVAEKHDTVVALRREAAQLEEQLRQAEMQAHFKDDIIKQLRREVKLARAKESLVEMLGLKESPRLRMKEELESLRTELEDKEAIVAHLEARLAGTEERVAEAKVEQLERSLASRERDLLALCNKMDYVRRYIKRLRDDEDLSIKCGLEALVRELDEDEEWNRETRRSVSSLNEETPHSVIIINRVPARSLSLPDSTLQKSDWSSGNWSGSNKLIRNNRMIDSESNKSMVTVDSEEVHRLKEAQLGVEDSFNTLVQAWNCIKDLSFNQNDSDQLFYRLNCVEDNLASMLELLTKDDGHSCSGAGFWSSSKDFSCDSLSNSKLNLYALADNLTMSINNSLCIIQQIKTEKSQFPELCGQERVFHKLKSNQSFQSDKCTISTKLLQFDNTLECHQKAVAQIRSEITNLVRKLCGKQSVQLKKPVLSTQSNCEISQLKQIVSMKDKEIEKKEQIIGVLKKSLTQKAALRTSRSAPFPEKTCYSDSDAVKHLNEKSCLTQRIVNELRKEIESAMCKFFSREDKLTDIEKDMYAVSKSLNCVQNSLSYLKKQLQESGKQICNLYKLEADLSQAELDVQRLLCKTQGFTKEKKSQEKSRIESRRAIASLQSDLSHLQMDLLESFRAAKEQICAEQITSSESPSSVSKTCSGLENNNCPNLKSQFESYRKRVGLLEEDACTSENFPQARNSMPVCEWGEIPVIAMAATLDSTQQQLLELQQDMRLSLEEAYKVCKKHDSSKSTFTSGKFGPPISGLMKSASLQEMEKDLHCREKVIEKQQKTIATLQNEIQEAKSQLKNISAQFNLLKCEKENIEKENQRVMLELQAKISSLQADLQSGNTGVVSNKGWVPWAQKQAHQSHRDNR